MGLSKSVFTDFIRTAYKVQYELRCIVVLSIRNIYQESLNIFVHGILYEFVVFFKYFSQSLTVMLSYTTFLRLLFSFDIYVFLAQFLKGL